MFGRKDRQAVSAAESSCRAYLDAHPRMAVFGVALYDHAQVGQRREGLRYEARTYLRVPKRRRK